MPRLVTIICTAAIFLMHNVCFSAEGNWNIAGIRLGASPDEAQQILRKELNDLKIWLHSGKLSYKGFEMPEMLYGFGASNGRRADEGKDRVECVFSLSTPSKVIAVNRWIQYDATDALPTLASVRNTLTEKYGKPNLEYTFGTASYIYWFDGTAEQLKKENLLRELGKWDLQNVFAMGEGDMNSCMGNKNDFGKIVCVELSANKESFVYMIRYKMIDYPQVVESCNLTWQSMKRGADSKLKDDLSKGDQIKPKL